MKEKFQEPVLEIIEMNDDVVCASTGCDQPDSVKELFL